MHQAGIVRQRQRCGHRFDHLQGTQGAHRGVRGDHVAQRGSLDELHDNIGTAMILPLVEDADHRPITQPGGRPGLTVELRGEVGVVAQSLMHHLDRHYPLKTTVPGPIHRGHAASGQSGQHLIATI